MSLHGEHASPRPQWPQPRPGAPYTVFLRRGWYAPRDQRALAPLGFSFGAPNPYGHAEPVGDMILVPDMPLSQLFEMLRPLGLTLSIAEARHWYGWPLPTQEFFWYIQLHADDA